jgi:predicted ester cyclase
MGMPPTGRRIALDGMTIQRIQEGRIVEGWIQPDAMSLVRQIAVSEPDQA